MLSDHCLQIREQDRRARKWPWSGHLGLWPDPITGLRVGGALAAPDGWEGPGLHLSLKSAP